MTETKVCSQCKEDKPFTEYYTKRAKCKTCIHNNKKCIHNKHKYTCRVCNGKGICEHDNVRSRCDICRTPVECEHGSDKLKCKECRNKSIKCEHDKSKYDCKECNGSNMCEHGRRKRYCRECKGAGICEHGKRKSRCKECGGKDLCEHGKEKYNCKDCEGKGICEHGRQKYSCKECGGGGVCGHGRQRYTCKECKGDGICEHYKIRSKCKECGGNSICEHNKERTSCKECGGGSLCEHGRRRSSCKECKGGGICEHLRIRCKCIDCNPDIGCIECKKVYTHKTSLCYPYCKACFCNKFPDHENSTLYKIKERYLKEEVEKEFSDINIRIIHDRIIEGGCSLRRPDILIDLLTHSIIIECDENQHINYECENKRMMEIFQDLGSRPMVFIRFNPDKYIDSNRCIIETCFKPLIKEEDINKKRFYDINKNEWNNRIKVLVNTIRTHLQTIPSKEITEIKLFYDGV